jgi:hypothetical protein
VQKLKVRRRNKYGGLSERNPSETDFEDWIKSRVKVYPAGAEIFQTVRSGRSRALVSREDISKFRIPEVLQRAE